MKSFLVHSLWIMFFLQLARVANGITLSSHVNEKDVAFKKAKLSVSPSRVIDKQSYRLQADQDIGVDSLSTFYNDIDQAPFGPYIDLSFEALGESYNFESVPLDISMSAPKYVVYGADHEVISSSSLPLTTYSTMFTESDGTEALLVASLDVVDQSVYTQIVRTSKPSVATHTLKLAKLGFAASPTLLTKLADFETLDESSDSDESEENSYISYLLEGNNGDFCGSDKHFHDVVPVYTERNLHALKVYSSCNSVSTQKSYAINTGIIIDYSTYKFYEANTSAFNTFLAAVFAVNSSVYNRQMRIQWAVREIRVYTDQPSDTTSWNAAVGACPDMEDQLEAFTAWGKKNLSNYGIWQLYTICSTTQYGTVGMAWIGALCTNNYYYSVSKPYILSGVNTIGHEVGHNFGSKHAWDITGGTQGQVGGIMDYNTNGRLLSTDSDSPGEYGFHSSSETQICTHINSRLTAANIGDMNKCFTETTGSNVNPVCGNGIIEDGEECELSYGDIPGSSSKCCNNCKLVENANCSVDSECCVDCRIADSTPCTSPTGTLGLCGFGPNGSECITPNMSTPCSDFSPRPIDNCTAFCGTAYFVYKPDFSVCPYKDETIPYSGVCINNVCRPGSEGYKWAVGQLTNICACEPGESSGYYIQSIYCINNRSDIVHEANCDASSKPAPTSCNMCDDTSDITTDDSSTDTTTDDSSTDTTTDDSSTDTTTDDSSTDTTTDVTSNAVSYQGLGAIIYILVLNFCFLAIRA